MSHLRFYWEASRCRSTTSGTMRSARLLKSRKRSSRIIWQARKPLPSLPRLSQKTPRRTWTARRRLCNLPHHSTRSTVLFVDSAWLKAAYLTWKRISPVWGKRGHEKRRRKKMERRDHTGTDFQASYATLGESRCLKLCLLSKEQANRQNRQTSWIEESFCYKAKILKKANTTDLERDLQRTRLRRSTNDRRRRKWAPSVGRSGCFFSYYRLRNLDLRFLLWMYLASILLERFRSARQNAITFFAAHLAESSLREELATRRARYAKSSLREELACGPVIELLYRSCNWRKLTERAARFPARA